MPDYLVTDPATGQRIKMTGPAPPSEALIRLALAKVQPLPSHAPTQLQTADPLQAMQKAQTIGPARVGERYQEDLNPSLVGIARKVLGGAQRPASVAAEDPYGIGAWLKGAGPMPTPIAAEIQAYHGSPHDFEKFLLEKIGTGEGAQAYGHGLYFAENPAVAEEYKRNLTDYAVKVGDKAYSAQDTLSDPVARAARALANHGGDVDLAKRELWDASLGSYTKDRADFLHQAIKSVDDVVAKGGAQKLTGKMYEVSIKADPDQFLDWDKPLSQQPPEVQKALEKHGFVSWDPDTEAPKGDSNSRNMTGAAIYNSLAAEKWPSGAPRFSGNPMKAEATEVLRQAGIPGIKYLDQGSRNSSMLAVQQGKNLGGGPRFTVNGPQGDMHFDTMKEAQDYIAKHQSKATSNYVVFDDKLIDILKKYAVAGAVGGSLASLGQPPAEEQK